jgi:hypothetical protein
MNPYRPSNPSESEASPHQTMNVETENQEKSVPDPRVVAALDDLGYEYEFKADSTHFNVSFNMDEGRSQCVFISSATHEFLGVEFRHTWVDLAYVLPDLYSEHTSNYRALDDWLKHFAIGNDARHNALADALATAQLGLIALRAARLRRGADLKFLQDMEKTQRWLSATR